MLQSLQINIAQLQSQGEQVVAGSKVKVISNWNGQSCGGRSRRSRQGDVFEVESVLLGDNAIVLFLKGERCGIRLDEVEFVD